MPALHAGVIQLHFAPNQILTEALPWIAWSQVSILKSFIWLGKNTELGGLKTLREQATASGKAPTF